MVSKRIVGKAIKRSVDEGQKLNPVGKVFKPG